MMLLMMHQPIFISPGGWINGFNISTVLASSIEQAVSISRPVPHVLTLVAPACCCFQGPVVAADTNVFQILECPMQPTHQRCNDKFKVYSAAEVVWPLMC